jgi:hypothetical protein
LGGGREEEEKRRESQLSESFAVEVLPRPKREEGKEEPMSLGSLL